MKKSQIYGLTAVMAAAAVAIVGVLIGTDRKNGGNEMSTTDLYSGYYYTDKADIDEYTPNEDGSGVISKQREMDKTAADDYSDSNMGSDSNQIKYSDFDMNDFLTDFAAVYFSEDESFSDENYDDYELIRFAFCDLKRKNPEKILYGNVNGVKMAGISEDNLHSIITSHFSIEPEFGEKVSDKSGQASFILKNGAYYMPVADGISYDNKAIVTAEANADGLVEVEFIIYSGLDSASLTPEQAEKLGKKYGTGSAEVAETTKGMRLISYYVEY